MMGGFLRNIVVLTLHECRLIVILWISLGWSSDHLLGGRGGKVRVIFSWVVTIYTRITNRRLPGRELAFGQAMFDGERRPWVFVEGRMLQSQISEVCHHPQPFASRVFRDRPFCDV